MRSIWMMARAFAMALLCLWAAGCVAIEAGHEGVLVEQPFFFGHGGVDPVPSKTGRVAVALRRSASGPAPADLPVDGVLLLGLPGLDVVGTERFEPLQPYFPGVFIWDSLAVGPDWLAVGMGDGRLVFRAPEQVEALGAPVLAGSVPIAASIGFVRATGDRLFAVTSRTAIPYEANNRAHDRPMTPAPTTATVVMTPPGSCRPAWRERASGR